MQPISVTVGPLAAASANAICLSQTPAVAGALTLNGALVTGGVAVLDKARRVLITCAGNESTRTFTIVGTSSSGNSLTETITGPNATTAQSVLDYKTVTSITISGAAAGAITVGTSGVASSRWVRLDGWAFAQVGLQVDVSGTINYTVQQTFDDPNDPTNPIAAANVIWLNSTDSGVVAKDVDAQSFYAYAPTFIRITANSGTGSARLTAIQYGNVPL
jgi:hypothetical protein